MNNLELCDVLERDDISDLAAEELVALASWRRADIETIFKAKSMAVEQLTAGLQLGLSVETQRYIDANRQLGALIGLRLTGKA